MVRDIWAIPLLPTNFNVIVAFLGGFLSLFGLVSYLLKQHFYLSEALIALVGGIAFGPVGASWIRPLDYAQCHCVDVSPSDCKETLDAITLDFSRLVLSVQLVLAGVQLPKAYLFKEWMSIFLLVGPGMTCMWLATSLLVWIMAGLPNFLHALVIGACVAPTDPVLSAVIVKGKFADHNISKELQNLIIAESGLNDGLGYPFLFFALYLIKYTGPGATSGGIIDAVGLWFIFTWGYTIILSVIYGALVGWSGRKLLYWAESRNYVDRESFLIFAIALALFILGTCGFVGSDDVLACFIAGNAFTWDDWFRLETMDDSLQPTIDMLLNVTIFLWYGANIPWEAFLGNAISVWQLCILGFLVLLLRRLPWVFAMHRWIPQIEETRQAIFVGFFGPIGVSAIFYLFITLEFIDEHLYDQGSDSTRSDVANLAEMTRVVHGLSIPLGKLGYLAPQTLSRVVSESLSDESHRAGSRRRLPMIGDYLSWNVLDTPRGNGWLTGPISITGTRPLQATAALRGEPQLGSPRR